MEITPKTMISDIIKKYPASAKVFKSYHMACLSCMGLASETLEKGCLMHGLELNAVLEDLKKAAK